MLGVKPEEDCSKRGNSQVEGIGVAVHGDGLRYRFSEIAKVRAAVFLGVAVENFLPDAGSRNADAIVLSEAPE